MYVQNAADILKLSYSGAPKKLFFRFGEKFYPAARNPSWRSIHFPIMVSSFSGLTGLDR